MSLPMQVQSRLYHFKTQMLGLVAAQGSCTCSVRIIGLDLSDAIHATMTKPAMAPPTGLTGACKALLCCRWAHLARSAS